MRRSTHYPHRLQMRLEKLESRQMLATYTVDSLADVVDPNDGVRTLREAIGAANSIPGRDIVNFDLRLSFGTIVLTQGEIEITESVEIIGLGADRLTIDASGSDPTPEFADGFGSRVFYVESISDPRGVTIQRLTLTGGDCCSIDGPGGGAIRTRGATLTIRDTVIRNNYAFFDGGGIYGAGQTVLERVWLDSNHAGDDGGGIYAGGLIITDSTISNNVADGDGGGIRANSYLEISGSTLSGNSTLFGVGGGIDNKGRGGNITTSTIVNNSAPGGPGGIDGGVLSVQNSIIAQNDGNDLIAARSVIFRYSLISVFAGTRLRPTPEGEPDANGNLVGTSSNPKDPQLGVLADNGGLAPTHMPVEGSRVINSGDPSFVVESSGLDQRGQPRRSGARIDMGSVEFQLPSIDFNGNGVHDCPDVDLIVSSIAAGIHPQQFDINGDGQVSRADLTEWLTIAGLAHESGEPFREGDANLDGVVDGTDFGIWNENRFTNTPEWCSGDFNADGSVDGSDFNNWLLERFERPEPVGRADIVGETRPRLPRAPLRSFIEPGETSGPIPRDTLTLFAAAYEAFNYVPVIEFERSIPRVWQPRERPHGFAIIAAATEHSRNEQQELREQIVDSVISTWKFVMR